MELVLDFETRSACNIRKIGHYKYAQHDTTEVLMLSVLDVASRECWIWIPEQFRVYHDTELSDDLLDNMVATAEKIIAHNAPFERSIWRDKMEPKGFRPLDVNNVYDTAVQASMVGLPRSLEKAMVNLDPEGEQKDTVGAKLLKQMMSCRAPLKSTWETILPEDPERVPVLYKKAMEALELGEYPDFPYENLLRWRMNKQDFCRLVEYCRQDVVAEAELFRRLPKMSDSEHKLWVLDQKINDKGVLIDREAVDGAILTLDCHRQELFDRVFELTGQEVENPKSPVQLKDWMGKQGVVVDSISKESVEYLLTLNLPLDVRRVLEVRKSLGKSSTAKYQAMVNMASSDNRLRGISQFCGAQTGRWAGRGVQLQNLPRPSKGNIIGYPKKEMEVDEEAVECLASGDSALCELWFKDVSVLAADCIRGMMVSSPGYDYIASDFSAIEGRCLAWLAGEEPILEAYREGKDIYKVIAASIYNVPYEEVTDDQRKDGKTAELACGYQGGYGALCKFGFDKIDMSKDERLRALGIVDEVMSSWDLSRNPKPDNLDDIDRPDVAEFLKIVKGTHIVKMWRENHPKVKQFWNMSISSAIYAVENPGTRTSFRGIKYEFHDDLLQVTLRSGRDLWYFKPMVEAVEMPWSTEERPKFSEVLTSLTTDALTKQIARRTISPGILTENITQATARDILASALFSLDKAGYETVFHVHDEVIAEVAEGKGSVEEFERLMATVPEWAEGFPVKAAGGYRSKRYRKG